MEHIYVAQVWPLPPFHDEAGVLQVLSDDMRS